MRFRVVWSLVCALLIACLHGCSMPQQGGSATHNPPGALRAIDRIESVEVSGIERTYWLHLPAAYDSTRAVPLVIVLHGQGGTAKQMAQISDFNALSDTEGFVVAYPEAFERQWYIAHTSPGASRIDDVRFIAKLIDQLSVLLNIDRKQVYVAGMSTGGILAQRLACELSGRIAAIACVAGPLTADMADKCTPTQPVSVLMVHGTADETVPYAGGRVRGPADTQVLSVAQTIERWLTADGCQDRTPTETALAAGTTSRIVARSQAYACNQGTAVVLYTIEGGSHAWPGGPTPGPFGRFAAPASRDFDATHTIWEFFRTHPRR